MMRRLAVLIVLMCAACADPTPMGPNAMILAGQGMAQDTVSAQQAMSRQAQATQAAVAAQGQAQQQTINATAQAIALAQADAANRATATVQAMELIGVQATAQSIERQSTQAEQASYLSGMATITAMASQAVATQQAGERRQKRENTLWGILVVALSAFLCVGVIIAFLLGRQAERVVSARADAAIARARRQYLLETSVGLVDAETNEIIAAPGGAPSEADVVDMPQRREPTSLEAFVLRAAHAAPEKWEATYIPRFDRMGIGASGWTARTDELVSRGLVAKTTNGTVLTSGNLRNLFAVVR